MQAEHAIYLDANAGFPTRFPPGLEGLLSQNGGLGANPSSIHSYGRTAKAYLTRARDQVAQSIGLKSADDIVFCSSGTEANQGAIYHGFESAHWRGIKHPLWIVGRTCHASILKQIPIWERKGGRVVYLEVDDQGRLQFEKIEPKSISEFDLVSVEWVNNETGVIQDLAPLKGFQAQGHGLVHVDGAQAWGKLKLNGLPEGVDILALSGHKIGALPGVGAIVLTAKAKGAHTFIEGSQELGRRGGTENVLGIYSLGAAASKISELIEKTQTLEMNRDQFESELRERFSDWICFGKNAPRVGNTSLFTLGRLEGRPKPMVAWMDQRGFMLSAGSACEAGVERPSHVLLAMGIGLGFAGNSLRVSLLDEFLAEDRKRFMDALEQGANRFPSEGQ